jgi:hypothetical protein
MLTREILELTRRDGEVLAAIKTQLDRLESKLDGIDQKLDRFDHLSYKIDRIGEKIDQLSKCLPDIIAAAVRKALREHYGH